MASAVALFNDHSTLRLGGSSSAARGVSLRDTRRRERSFLSGSDGRQPAHDRIHDVSDMSQASVSPLVRHDRNHKPKAPTMATNQEGNILTERCNSLSDYGQRAAAALNALLSGPHKDKAAARVFACSVRMAKYLRAGQFWTIERLNQASKAFNDFDAYLADPLLAQCNALLRQIGEVSEMLANRDKGNDAPNCEAAASNSDVLNFVRSEIG